MLKEDSSLKDNKWMTYNRYNDERTNVTFPYETALEGMKIDIREAQATQEQDQKRITGWVEALDGGGDNNKACELVNKTVRKMFFQPALERACLCADPEMLKDVVDLANNSFIGAAEDWKEIFEEQHERSRKTSLPMALVGTYEIDVGCKEKTEENMNACLKRLLELGQDPDQPYGDTTSLGNALVRVFYDMAGTLLRGRSRPREDTT